MDTSSNRTLGITALVGAAVAFTFHILAILGFTPLGIAPVFPLFLLGLASFAAMILQMKARGGRSRAGLGDMFAMIPDVPLWGKLLFAAVFIYAGINFFWFLAATGGGTLEQAADGHYIVSEHGRFVRDLDANGVRAFQAWEVRLFTGHSSLRGVMASGEVSPAASGKRRAVLRSEGR